MGGGDNTVISLDWQNFWLLMEQMMKPTTIHTRGVEPFRRKNRTDVEQKVEFGNSLGLLMDRMTKLMPTSARAVQQV